MYLTQKRLILSLAASKMIYFQPNQDLLEHLFDEIFEFDDVC